MFRRRLPDREEEEEMNRYETELLAATTNEDLS